MCVKKCEGERARVCCIYHMIRWDERQKIKKQKTQDAIFRMRRDSRDARRLFILTYDARIASGIYALYFDEPIEFESITNEERKREGEREKAKKPATDSRKSPVGTNV